MEQGVYGGCLLCPLYPLLVSLEWSHHRISSTGLQLSGHAGCLKLHSCNRLRVVPIFPQGQWSKRNASARENHPTRERRNAAGREKNQFLSPRRVSPFSCGMFFTRAGVSLAPPSLRKNGDYSQSVHANFCFVSKLDAQTLLFVSLLMSCQIYLIVEVLVGHFRKVYNSIVKHG